MNQYLCTLCGKNFSTFKQLEEHVYNQHKDNQVHKCNVCEKECIGGKKFRNHLALEFTNYLRAIRNLHQMCTALTLGNYEEIIDDFQDKFFVLFDNHDMNMTLKIHVITAHYKNWNNP